MNSEETNPPAVVLSTTLLNVARSHQPKGYTMENVHFVTARVNRMKGDMTWDEFVSTCKQVVEHCK